jgi:hypothetical protein
MVIYLSDVVIHKLASTSYIFYIVNKILNSAAEKGTFKVLVVRRV